MQLIETLCHWEVPLLCSLVLKYVAFKCLCYTNDSITPLKFASGDNVLPPEREERTKLTSATSLCPRHFYYDFLLKRYLSYNEFSPSTRGAFAQTNFCLCSGEHSNETCWQRSTKCHKDLLKYSKSKIEVLHQSCEPLATENLFYVLKEDKQSWKISLLWFLWHGYGKSIVFQCSCHCFLIYCGNNQCQILNQSFEWNSLKHLSKFMPQDWITLELPSVFLTLNNSFQWI